MFKELGSGVDGKVFYYSPTKVIKQSNYISNSIILDYIIKYNPNHIVHIYDYKVINNIYYYIMDKLNSISQDEYKVFHSILSHEDNNRKKNYSNDKLFQILSGLSFGLEFDYDKVFNFYQAIQNSNINHNDIHPRNIMKDELNNFKLIDIDRATIK